MGAIFTNSWLLLASACAWCFGITGSMTIRNFGVNGGTPVSITEVPFMAIFTYKPHVVFCGASIISEQFLITAAHCAQCGTNFVFVGTDNINEGVMCDMETVITHPKYNSATADYDIAIIKLKNKLTLNDRVQPIKIADSSVNPSPGEMMTTIGFGYTKPENETSTRLLKVDIPYFDRAKCAKIYQDINNDPVTDRMICAGGEAGKSSCHGDSGGPLFYQGQLIGVVSWGRDPCALEGFPVVYSYVPSMRDFIDNVTKTYS